MAWGSHREEREEAGMPMVLQGLSVTDSRAEGNMGAHEVRVGASNARLREAGSVMWAMGRHRRLLRVGVTGHKGVSASPHRG